MSTPLSEQVAAAAAELREQQRRLAGVRDQLATSAGSATSPDHLVTVTLDGRGEVSDVAFHTTKYRKMAPAELGAAIVGTIHAARAAALDRAVAAYQQFFPRDLDLRKVMAGEFDLDEMFADAIRTAEERLPGEDDPGAATAEARRG